MGSAPLAKRPQDDTDLRFFAVAALAESCRRRIGRLTVPTSFEE
jgi:hypothetical protein